MLLKVQWPSGTNSLTTMEVELVPLKALATIVLSGGFVVVAGKKTQALAWPLVSVLTEIEDSSVSLVASARSAVPFVTSNVMGEERAIISVLIIAAQ